MPKADVISDVHNSGGTDLPAQSSTPSAARDRVIRKRVDPEERIKHLAARWKIDFDRVATAYHEAGHAMAGYWFGWVIGQNGVEIVEHQICSFGCPAFAYTVEARAVVAMAGWLAERKWHGQGGTDWENQLVHILDAHHWGQIIVGNDDQQVVQALVGNREPDDIETKEFLLAIHAFREQAMALMARPAFWASIRRVARALLVKGKLSDIDVVNAVGQKHFLQISHGHWTARSDNSIA